MSNTIIKTALKTLLGVIIALLVAFAIASLGFPGSMATMFEKCESYSLATGYASLNYSYTHKVEDLARCFQDSVLSKNDKDIIRFGTKLINDEKFEEICAKKNSQLENITDNFIDYRQTVYGSVACAKYRQGDKDGAIDTANKALEGEQGFPAGNAFVQLSLQVINSKDKKTALILLDELKDYQTDDDYFNAVKKALSDAAD